MMQPRLLVHVFFWDRPRASYYLVGVGEGHFDSVGANCNVCGQPWDWYVGSRVNKALVPRT